MDDDKPELVTVTLKLPADVLEAYGAAAKAASLNRHQWMRLVLDSACGRSELPEKGLGAPVARGREPRRARKRVKADEMGLGAGGSMHQKIYPDPHGIDTWNQVAAGRIFIHLISADAYEEITGKRPPAMPESAQGYVGPWFGVNDANSADIPAPGNLQGVKSIGEMDVQHGFEGQQDDSPINESVSVSFAPHGVPTVRDGDW